MAKIRAILLLLLCFIFIGCKEQPVDFMDKVVELRGKLEIFNIFEAPEQGELITKTDGIYEREYLETIYSQNKLFYINDYAISPNIIYLLNRTINHLEELDNFSLNKLFEVVHTSNTSSDLIKYKLSINKDSHLLIYFEEYPIDQYQGPGALFRKGIIKLGYENEKVFFKLIGIRNDSILYEEYLENSYYNTLNTSSLRQSLRIVKNDYGMEIYKDFNNDYFNVHLRSKTEEMRLEVKNNHYTIRRFSLFDDLGRIFDLSFFQNEYDLKYNLFYSNNWDFILINNPEYRSEGDGLFRNSQLVVGLPFLEWYMIDKSLTVTLIHKTNDLTDQVLSLDNYGLNFYDSKLNLVYFEQLRQEAESKTMQNSIFKGVDFRNNVDKTQFITLIDQELYNLVK